MRESGPSFSVPSEGYAVEREQAGRVLFSYDVDGRTKVAMFAADGIRDWNGDEGWGIRAWAQCDPSELPPDVTDDLNIGVWEDESGRRVPVTRIQSFQGAEHCSWTDITFLLVGPEETADWYVRDAGGGEFSRLLRTTFAQRGHAPRGRNRYGVAPRRPAALDRPGPGGGLPGEPRRCGGCRALAGGQAAHPVPVSAIGSRPASSGVGSLINRRWLNQRARAARAEVVLLGDEGVGRLVERAGRLRAREEVDVDATDATGAELDVAGAAPAVGLRLLAAAQTARSATQRRRGLLPRRRPPPSARRSSRRPRPRTRPETASRASSGSRARSRPLRPSRSPRPRRGRGASGRRGRGRRAARCRRRARRRLVPGRESSRGGRGRTRCHARQRRQRARWDVSGDGGTGVPNGMTKEISQSSRTPRADR